MAYKAWGACGECDFVGDMWWHDEEDEMGQAVKIAVCPTCMCATPEDEMAEFPGEASS